MSYEQLTRFYDALSYTGYHLAWVPEYYDVSLVIYRVYPYGYEVPYYGLFILRDGRPPILRIVTTRIWIMAREMENQFIPHEALDWQHEPQPMERELSALSHQEATILVREWLLKNVLSDDEQYEYRSDYDDAHYPYDLYVLHYEDEERDALI